MQMTQNGPVIVVDDDQAVRESLKFALELEGLNVRIYRGARELLSEPNLETGGCLVIDYLMPGLNGCELVQELRKREIGCPAILIASDLTPEVLGCALTCGARCVLAKPLEDDSLLREIQAALRESETQQTPTA